MISSDGGMLLHKTLCSNCKCLSIPSKIIFCKTKIVTLFYAFSYFPHPLFACSYGRIIMLMKMIFSTKILIKLTCWYLPGTDKNAIFLLTHTLLVCCLLHYRWNKDTSYHKKRIWCCQTKRGHLQGGKGGEPTTFSEKHSYRPDHKFQHTKLCF